MHESSEHGEAGVGREMPRYVSHKKVWALEIDSISTDPGLLVARTLTFRDKGYAPMKAPDEMFSRYSPVPGDFYVQYADGYKSFSPRKAFLDGYTKEPQGRQRDWRDAPADSTGASN